MSTILTLTSDQLAAIRARAEAATPGPWEIAAPTMAGNERHVIEAYGLGSIAVTSMNGAPRTQERLAADDPACAPSRIATMRANATFISCARTDIPSLLAHIEEQRKGGGAPAAGRGGGEMNEDALFRSATEAKLFLTEIINDLHKHGFERGGKAETMLHDLARDAGKQARDEFPASRLRKVHADLCDRRNW